MTTGTILPMISLFHLTDLLILLTTYLAFYLVYNKALNYSHFKHQQKTCLCMI